MGTVEPEDESALVAAAVSEIVVEAAVSEIVEEDVWAAAGVGPAVAAVVVAVKLLSPAEFELPGSQPSSITLSERGKPCGLSVTALSPPRAVPNLLEDEVAAADAVVEWSGNGTPGSGEELPAVVEVLIVAASSESAVSAVASTSASPSSAPTQASISSDTGSWAAVIEGGTNEPESGGTAAAVLDWALAPSLSSHAAAGGSVCRAEVTCWTAAPSCSPYTFARVAISVRDLRRKGRRDYQSNKQYVQ